MDLAKLGHRLGAAAITLLLLALNLRLYGPGSEAYGPERLGPDVVPQLRFISESLRAGSGEQMQNAFPEGFFFTHVLYGLAWVEVGLREPNRTPLHNEALREAGWALDKLNSSAGRASFSAAMNPAYGVFYKGWTGWLRGGVLMIQPAESRPAGEVARFEADCLALADAFNRGATPYLSAYPGQAWPVDSVVAMAFLRLHDKLFPPRFGATVERWLRLVRERLDPATGLIPHRVDPVTGKPIEGARGSSQSLIARFLIEVDPAWGRAQYALFRQQFVAPFLGVPGVREYPAGEMGFGDVDSGPLVFGFSASATVAAIAAAQVQNDREVSSAIISASEAAGLPIEWRGRKLYALGLLPVGDAFLVWTKTSRLWIATGSDADLPAMVARWWRWPLHTAAFLIFLIVWLPVYGKGCVGWIGAWRFQRAGLSSSRR
jgi:hypothetical protein